MQAAPVQWAVADGGNDHWYQAVYVPDRITWTDAQTQAVAAGGYLATISSSAENAFVASLVTDLKYWYNNSPWNNSIGPWFGGYKDTVNFSVWHWVTGEDWSFSQWDPGEPNNLGGGENRTHFFSDPASTAGSNWNDIGVDDITLGYVIEYNIPEPATLCLLTLGAFTLIRRRA
ncbi:MAG: lectin-like protein [Phycisphaeraceae bacterium]